MPTTVKIEPHYKVTIPKDTRDAFDLRVGEEVEIILRRMNKTYTPTARERRAIEKGREEIRRGEYLTLDQFFQHLDVERHPPKARAKNSTARPTGRTKTSARRS